MGPTVQLLRGLLRDQYLSHLTQDADGETAYFGCPGTAEDKGESGTLLLQHQRTSLGHHREQEMTSTWKRNLQFSLTGKLHAQAQRNYVLQKGFLRPPDSPASPTGEGLPCKKTERGGCFIKYIKLNNNHKIMRHKNKQRNMAQSKEQKKPIPRKQKSMNYMTKNSN